MFGLTQAYTFALKEAVLLLSQFLAKKLWQVFQISMLSSVPDVAPKSRR